MTEIIKYPKKIDLKKFEKNLTEPEIKFGLQEKFNFAKNVLFQIKDPIQLLNLKILKTKKRKQLILMKMVFVILVIIIQKKIKLIGKKEN